MARKPRTSKPTIKAAADRAERRSKGETEDLEAPENPVLDPPEVSRSVGRPTKYKAEYAKQAEKLCKLGATDADLAEFFDVKTSTIWRWSGTHTEFCSALKTGKHFADQRVERALYQKAVGYEQDVVKIMQYEGSPVIVPHREKVSPDTTACIFWLKNRDPQNWRDKTEVKHDASEAFANLWQRVGGGAA